MQDTFNPKNFKEIKYQKLPELEKLILHKLFVLNTEIENNLKNYNFHKLQKDLFNFCALDLSSFYFDIRKDVLYCDDLNSEKRKSCVTILNVILECLLKWFAPVLSFTAEEINELIKKDKKESIHEENFPAIPNDWKNVSLFEKWEKLLNIRQQVNIAIEEKRSNKEIGSSLEADIQIKLPKFEYDILNGIDANELFITSNTVKNILENKKNKTTILVRKAEGIKCSRCWKILKKKCERNHCPIKQN